MFSNISRPVSLNQSFYNKTRNPPRILLETTKRSKLHTLSTNAWLKKRHPETTSPGYLFFPFEKKQHNMILEVFNLFNKTEQNSINIHELIQRILKFNSKIPKKMLWRLFHEHDFDRDEALNFEEFRACALSKKGKVIFSNILNKIHSKKKGANFLPLNFNSLITQVSYRSARNDLLNKICDTSLDINRRANNFFQLFGLRNKYKNPDEFEKSEQLVENDEIRFSRDNSFQNENKEKFVEFLNKSKISDENEDFEEIEKIINESKSKGEEIIKNLSKFTKTEKNINLKDFVDFKNLEKSFSYQNIQIQQERKLKNARKPKKINKIMTDNMNDSKKNKASQFFKKILGIDEILEKHPKRQIKFYPIQINKNQPYNIFDDKKEVYDLSIEKLKKKNLNTREFELYLPKLERVKDSLTKTKFLKNLPTINIFNEDFGKVKKTKQMSMNYE